MSFITFLRGSATAPAESRCSTEEAASTICISERTFFAPLWTSAVKNKCLCFACGLGIVLVLGTEGVHTVPRTVVEYGNVNVYVESFSNIYLCKPLIV